MKLDYLLEQTQDKKLIIVDIQPLYEKYINFNINKFLDFTKSYDDILYLYNGNSIGAEEEHELRDWLFDHFDYDEEEIDSFSHKTTFFDKGYGFFRDVMDYYGNFDKIVKLIRYMRMASITDTRDFTDEQKELIDKKLGINFLEEGLTMYFPEELLQKIVHYKNSDIVGGGKNECLLEVELLLRAYNIKYNTVNKFVY